MADLIDWMWTGGTTEHGFNVAVELLAAATDARLLVSRNADLSNPVFRSLPKAATALTGPAAATYEFARFSAGGLVPNTRYYYTIETGAGIDTAKAGQVTTMPVPGRAANFRVCFGSCSNATLATPDKSFAAIKAENPLLFVHMGDLHYSDIATDDLPAVRAGIRSHTRLAAVLAAYKATSIAYMYDDHDAGPNDAHQDTTLFSTFMGNTLTAYRELVPHYPLAQPAGVGWARCNAQKFTIGRVRFLMPDLRTFRNTSATPKTTLGDGRTTSSLASWNQKLWLMGELATAKVEGIGLVVLVSSSTVPGTIGGSWEVEFADEFADLMDVAGNADTPEILIVTGDAHAFGFDDGGVVAKLAPNSAARVLLVQSSPLRSNPLALSGPLSWQGVDTETNDDADAYVVIDFADDGKRVTWTATPKGDDGVAFAGAKGGPFSNADATPVVEIRDTETVVSATENFARVAFTKSWIGFCTAQWIARPQDGADRGDSYSGFVEFGENQAVAYAVFPIRDDNHVLQISIDTPIDCEIGAQNTATVAVVRDADMVPGLVQWVDANDADSLSLRAVGNDRFVTQWRDKSGQGNHFAQATVANQPKFIADGLAPGRSVVRGDGLASVMVGPVLYASPRDPLTIIGICRAEKRDTTQRVWCLSNASSTPQHSVRFASNNKLEVLARGSATSELQEPDSLADAADSEAHLFCVRINAVAGRGETALDDEAFQATDNGSQFSNNLFTTTPTGSTLFAIDGSGGLSQFLQGDIEVVGVYNRAITDQEWARLRDGYLKPKMPTVFDPRGVPGLIQWIRPFDGAIIETREVGADTFVVEVEDASGQDNHMGTDANANQPKLVSDGGLPFLQGDGSAVFMRGPTIYSSPRAPAAVVGIARARGTGATQRIWTMTRSSSEPQHCVRFNSSNKIEPILRGASADGFAGPDSLADAAGNGWHVFCARFNSVLGKGEMALDDEAFQSETITAVTDNLFTSGGTGTTLFCIDGASGLADYLDGDIAVVAAYTRAISDTEWAALRDSYLKPILAKL